MISFNEAFELVMDTARPLGTERIAIADNAALNRVLQEDVVSDMDMPPFNKSAMDGYACRRADLGDEFDVVETLAAGVQPKKSIGPGQCAKIMTGAVVPEGADCVIMVEYTEQTGQNRIRFTGEDTDDNICMKGEDVKIGEMVLSAGELMRPQHIAVLASVGCVEPLVSLRPKVGVIATGSEIVDPATAPAPGQIRNSNGPQLAAQAATTGAIVKNYGIAIDTREELGAQVRRAMEECDVVVLSGGVSVGDYDFVREILKANGVKLLFEKIAVKPGRPMVFGTSDEAFCFGLPGNPVSTFVMFELFIRPFLYRVMGHDFEPAISQRRLTKTLTRKKIDRDSWLPVVNEGRDGIAQIDYHGSAHIDALCQADGLLCMPKGVEKIEEGTIVAVRQI
ncbi:MAG: molybdopterin molybdotransferase MoeA [Planctomycetota bacterium]